MEKKIISQEQAQQELIQAVEKIELGDRLYELIQDLCNKSIQDIESRCTIVDVDGVPYDDTDDVMWYDDCREDFMKAVFEKIQTGLF